MNSEALTLLLLDISAQLERRVEVRCVGRVDHLCISRFVVAVREQVRRINNVHLYPRMLFLSEQTIAVLDRWVRMPYRLVDVPSDRTLAHVNVDSSATQTYVPFRDETWYVLRPLVTFTISGRDVARRTTLADFIP